jgi:hypothetical protein
MKNLICILLFAFTSLDLKAEDKETPHLFGIERGIMDGLSFHWAPWKLDLALSYAVLFPVSNASYITPSYSEKTTITQTGVRLGMYWETYGISGAYINVFAGRMDIDQTRSGDSLGQRSGKSVGTFTAPGLGYHWFWDNFNLRLGLAAGPIEYTTAEYTNTSGVVVEKSLPFNSFGYNTGGGLDLAIGWAF